MRKTRKTKLKTDRLSLHPLDVREALEAALKTGKPPRRGRPKKNANEKKQDK